MEPHRLQHRQKRWHRELSRVTTSEAIVVDQAHKVYVAAYLSTVRCQHRPRAAVVMAKCHSSVKYGRAAMSSRSPVSSRTRKNNVKDTIGNLIRTS